MKFNEWVKFCFDRPVTEPAWHWAPEFDYLDKTPPNISIDLLTELFSAPIQHLRQFDDAQVNQGLWFLISSSCSPYIEDIFSEEVDWKKRKACIDTIGILFRELFSKRCIEKLSHSDFDGSTKKEQPLNSICYMFWDLIPWHSKQADRRVYESYLDVIEGTLAGENAACHESALHGLGHSVGDYPERVERIIDHFLNSRSWIREDLKQYALRARAGDIQ